MARVDLILLQKLKRMAHDTFGGRQGSKHAPPDLSKDYSHFTLTSRIRHRKVTLEADNGQIDDAVILGPNQLSGPSTEYNCLFESLREHRQVLSLFEDSPS